MDGVTTHRLYEYSMGRSAGLKTQMSKLQGFQDRFAKKITIQTDCGEEAINKLEWITLESRRMNYWALFAHQIVKGENIQHLQDLVHTVGMNLILIIILENIFLIGFLIQKLTGTRDQQHTWFLRLGEIYQYI